MTGVLTDQPGDGGGKGKRPKEQGAFAKGGRRMGAMENSGDRTQKIARGEIGSRPDRSDEREEKRKSPKRRDGEEILGSERE